MSKLTCRQVSSYTNFVPVRKTPLVANNYYHVYNRGAQKYTIFTDSKDYQAFISILSYYLKFTKKDILNSLGKGSPLKRTGENQSGIFQDKVKLLGFCLMPNHFHLLLFQTDQDAISRFMQRIGTTYSVYFNNRHKRTGTLFQGRFKTKHVDTDNYLLQSSKYIHRNPLPLLDSQELSSYPWSSYTFYLNRSHPNLEDTLISEVIDNSRIIEHFNSSLPYMSYPSFVEDSPPLDWYQNLLAWIK